MFAMRAPARHVATPSPEAKSGLEVYRYTFPAPPVHSATTLRGWRPPRLCGVQAVGAQDTVGRVATSRSSRKAALGDQIDDHSMFDDGDLRVRLGCGQEGAHDLGASAVFAVQDSPRGVALPVQVVLVAAFVEPAPVGNQLFDPLAGVLGHVPWSAGGTGPLRL